MRGPAWTDESGATAVEYGLVAGLVGLAMVAVGPWLAQVFVDALNVVLDAMLGA